MFGGRAFYTASHSPGRLVIDGVQPGDQATYTCRVDFKLAPTTISLVNLTVQSECAITITIVTITITIPGSDHADPGADDSRGDPVWLPGHLRRAAVSNLRHTYYKGVNQISR